MRSPVTATRVRIALIVATALAIGGALPGAARAQHSGGGSHGGGGGWHGGGSHGGGGWRGGGWGHDGHGGNWWWGPGMAAGVFAGAALADPYAYGYPFAYDYPSPYDYPVNPYAALGYTATAPTASYWYYCQNPSGYYPYVRQCATQWQPVPMQPAPMQPPG